MLEAFQESNGFMTAQRFLPEVTKLNLPWDNVSILLADERWVGEDLPHTNTDALR